MQIVQKARVRVPATYSTQIKAAARAVLETAKNYADGDLADAVNIEIDGQSSDTDFQRGLNRLPSDRESPLGVELPMSGSGADEAIGQYSMPAEQAQLLVRTYAELTDKLQRRVNRLEKAVVVLAAHQAGLAKAPSWDADDADDDETDNADDRKESAARATEKAIAAGKSVSVAAVMNYLTHRASIEPLRSPPDLTAGRAIQKALAGDAFSESLRGLTPSEHHQALTLQARLARVGHVDGLTVEKALFGIDPRVISACFPHLG